MRETETWMPMKTTQTVAMSTRHHSVESSGDGSDFGFTDGEEDKYDDDDDDDDNYTDPMDEEFSGSGDEGRCSTTFERMLVIVKLFRQKIT